MARVAPQLFFIMSAYHQPLDLQLGDIWYHIEPNEPYEISDGVFYVEKLMEIYGRQFGLIVMEQVKTRTGISLDTDAEMLRAKKHLAKCETEMLLEWVHKQQTERIPKNLPILPPLGRVKEIIDTRQIDLKQKFNFIIPGAEPFVDTEKDELRKENQRLRTEMAGTQATLDTIMDRLSAIEGAKTSGATGNAPAKR